MPPSSGDTTVARADLTVELGKTGDVGCDRMKKCFDGYLYIYLCDGSVQYQCDSAATDTTINRW